MHYVNVQENIHIFRTQGYCNQKIFLGPKIRFLKKRNNGPSSFCKATRKRITFADEKAYRPFRKPITKSLEYTLHMLYITL